MIYKNSRWHAAINLVVLMTFCITITRAIRLPNDFSEAHWLLDYRFGFMKRGLMGSLCTVSTSMLGLSMTSHIIAVLSGLSFCLMCGAFLIVLYRLIQNHRSTDKVVIIALLFSSSPFLVLASFCYGYFDALLYGFTILSVSLTLRNRPYITAVVQVVAILTHESYLIIGFPLVCFAAFQSCRTQNLRSDLRKHIISLSFPLIVFLGIAVFQSQVTTNIDLHRQILAYLGSFKFLTEQSSLQCAFVARCQTTGFFELLSQQNTSFLSRCLDPVGFIAVGPTFFAIQYFIHSSFRIRPFSPVSLSLLGVSIAPMVMHSVASDTTRISTYIIASALLLLWILSETREPQPVNELFFLVAIPTLFLNVFVHVPLMDFQIDRFSDIARLLFYFPMLVLAFFILMRKRA